MKHPIVNIHNLAYQIVPQTRLGKPKVGRICISHLHESSTKKRVRELRLANLCMTMSEIADIVGISRQRVFQILQEEGLPTKHYIKKYQYRCLVCGTIGNRKFCSDECKKKWQQVPIVCTRCGKLFTRNVTQFLKNYRHHNYHLFCSRYCSGKWSGEYYEFKSHANHVESSKSPT